jgi:hypothetical protein
LPSFFNNSWHLNKASNYTHVTNWPLYFCLLLARFQGTQMENSDHVLIIFADFNVDVPWHCSKLQENLAHVKSKDWRGFKCWNLALCTRNFLHQRLQEIRVIASSCTGISAHPFFYIYIFFTTNIFRRIRWLPCQNQSLKWFYQWGWLNTDASEPETPGIKEFFLIIPFNLSVSERPSVCSS